jgi:hypothetical protein
MATPESKRQGLYQAARHTVSTRGSLGCSQEMKRRFHRRPNERMWLAKKRLWLAENVLGISLRRVACSGVACWYPFQLVGTHTCVWVKCPRETAEPLP